MNRSNQLAEEEAQHYPNRRAHAVRTGTSRSLPLIWSMGVLYVSQPINDLLRMLGKSEFAHAPKVTVPIVFVCALVFLAQYGLRIRHCWHSVAWGLYALIGVSVGLIRGNTDIHAWLTQMWVPLFAVVMFESGYRLARSCIDPIRLLSLFGWVLIPVFFVTLCVFWSLKLTVRPELFLGISTTALLPILAAAVTTGAWWRILVLTLMVALAGKRGPMLAAIVCSIVAIPHLAYWRMGLLSRLLLAGASVSAVVLALYFLRIAGLDPSDLVIGGPALSKVYSSIPSEDAWSADRATSGRNMEVEVAWEGLLAEPAALWTGLGFGWSLWFDRAVEGSSREAFWQHYVHLSPLNLTLTVGVVWSTAFLVAWLIQCSRAYWTREVGGYPSKAGGMVAAIAVGAFASSMSGFHYGTDPLLWMSVGWIAGHSTRMGETTPALARPQRGRRPAGSSLA